MKEPTNQEPQPNPLTFEGVDEERTVLLGLARWDQDDQGRFRLQFLWKRVFVTLLVLAGAGWLGVSTAAWWFVTYKRGVENVSFIDIALPFRWDEYQRKRGDAYIAQAQTAMQEQRYREAFQMFRIGVVKSPANLDGRLELAQIYRTIGRSDLAMTLLEEGLPFAKDSPDYLSSYIQQLLANQEDDRLRALAADRLPTAEPGSRNAQLLAIGAAMAGFLRGEYRDAEDMIKTHRLEKTNDGRLLLARIEWERGHGEIALLQLRSMIRYDPTVEEPYAVLFEYLRTLDRHDEALNIAVERTVAFPESVAAQGALLQAYVDTENRERLAREIDRMVEAIPGEPANFFVLSEYAINNGDVNLAERLRAVAADNEVQPGIGTMVALEAHIAAGDYGAALAEVDKVTAEKPEWLAAQAVSLAGLQAVAYYGTGDPRRGERLLDQFLVEGNPNPQSVLVISRKLEQAGAPGAARRALARAAEDRAGDQAVLSRLVELDLDMNNLADLPANTQRLLAMRNPSTALLKRAYDILGSDRFLFLPDRDRLMASIAETIKRREAAAGT